MITTAGKNHVRRYMAQYVPAIAGAMAYGIGTRSESGADFGLNFEAGRVEITLINYDFVLDKIIYKATIPAAFGGTIYELGLYSLFADPAAGVNGSRVLTDINIAEPWVQSGTSTASTFVTDSSTGRTFPRIGIEGLSQTPLTTATRSDSLAGLTLDLSGYSSADFITVAVNIGNANTSAASVRFKTDNSNYYTFSLPSVTAGYKVVDFLKSSATATGSPSWANITEIQLNTTSGGGTSAVTWDGVMLQDTDTANLDYVLVARKVITPVTKPVGQSQDVEFTLDVSLP